MSNVSRARVKVPVVSPMTKELNNNKKVVVGYMSNGKPIMVGEPGLVAWKECWDNVLNEPSFRSFYMGGYLYDYTLPADFSPSPEHPVLRSFSLGQDDKYLENFIMKHQKFVISERKRIFKRKDGKKFDPSKPKGSILIKGNDGKEDHYVSYRIKGKTIKVFDSANTSGRYNAFFPHRYQKLLSLITGMNVVVSQNHPQCTKGDTFCQTWSIARLNSNLKPYTKYKPQKGVSMRARINTTVPLMSNIIYKISHSREKFINYFRNKKIHSYFKKIFDNIRGYYRLPEVPDSVDYFLGLSRRIKPRHIESIFANR